MSFGYLPERNRSVLQDESPGYRGSGEADDHGGNSGAGTGVSVVTRPIAKTRTPKQYKVFLLNDDYTPMDFVIHVLQKFFQKSYDEATRIMLQVHQQGAGLAGVFTYEIAETKAYQVNQYARQKQHPLKCTLEKD